MSETEGEGRAVCVSGSWGVHGAAGGKTHVPLQCSRRVPCTQYPACLLLLLLLLLLSAFLQEPIRALWVRQAACRRHHRQQALSCFP